MRVRRDQTPEEARRALEAAARLAWGEERVAALDRTIEVTAEALWLVTQEAVPVEGEEPE